MHGALLTATDEDSSQDPLFLDDITHTESRKTPGKTPGTGSKGQQRHSKGEQGRVKQSKG